MKTLIEIFENDITLKSDKWVPYFEVYETYFSKFKNKQINFIEVGVQGGGSMQMWREYFGKEARIYGIDINPGIMHLPLTDVNLTVGDQANVNFWNIFFKEVKHVDCFLDDGGHTMEQQINTLTCVWPRLQKNGVYICEDLHTSYYRDWGNGYKQEQTMVEFCKNLIDFVNLYHIEEKEEILKHKLGIFYDLKSIAFYDSMVVLLKGDKNWERRIVNS